MKKRSEFFKENIANLTEFIHLITGDDTDEISTFVTGLVKDRMVDRRVKNIVTVSPGNTKVKEDSLIHMLLSNDDNVVSASGSIYTRADVNQSEIGKMILDMMAQRKVFKKKMFAAIAANNRIEENHYNFSQATKKVGCNSMPGSFGSEYNPFYDKGNYNSITALNRSLIGHAVSTVEQCIGANDAIFTEEECINYITINVRFMPDVEKIKKVMDHYHILTISTEELFAYFLRQVNLYTKSDLPLVKQCLDNLNEIQISYLYYMGKFPYLFQKNETIFRGFFKRLFDLSCIKTDPSTTDKDLDEIDEDFVTAMQIIASEYLKGYPDLKDLKKKNHELYLWFIDCCKFGSKMIHQLDDLLDVFIFYPTDYQHIGTRHNMFRKAVPISDTDSCIATMVNWMLWYNEGDMFVNQDSYNITAIGIYFMTKCVEFSLYKYSIEYGARDKFTKTMKMKNEFLYVALILFALKKTYAGIVAIHEGIKLKKHKVDIKGGNLRSSAICKEATEFNRELIVKSVLEIYANGQQVGASSLINRVVEFEEMIYNDVRSGNMTFLEATAVKTAKEYEHPLSSDHFYYLAWQEIFSEKYGSIRLPSKFPMLKLKKITPLFIECIQDKTIKEKFSAFFDKYKKWPSAIVLNPMMEKFPRELIPLANIRDIIYLNIHPSYLTLEQLNISIGNEDKNMLLSDMYGNIRL